MSSSPTSPHSPRSNSNEDDENNNDTSIKNEQRNTEIWSTRLQRELLAMVTDNASTDAKNEMTAVLPSFCVVKDHSLDIEQGNCTITCLLNLPPTSAAGTSSNNSNSKTATTDESEKGTKTSDESKSGQEDQENNNTESENNDDGGKTNKEKPSSSESSIDVALISIMLDVSLKKKSDGSVDPAAVSYPFLKPVAILTSGCNYFPQGSTIKDGDNIDIEMDWTPSLHLSDAILNIALKIKECLSQGETVHPGAVESLTALPPKADVVGDVVNRAKKLGSSFGFSLRNLTESTGKNSNEGGKPTKRSSRLGLGRKKKVKKPVRPKANPSEVRIGDEINMLEAPWVNCQGVYSCKAIRRPKFVDEAIAEAEPKENRLDEKETSQVANAGFAGAGAMLRSFTNSARGVLEESFLMITESHIIEMRSNKLNLSTGTVTFAIPIEMMAKLKFRRQESVSLFFKPAPDDPLIYMCPDSADCVHQIQAVLKRHGVKGKHTNAATHRAINQALHFVQEIQTKELALKHDPSIDRVNEIMDLYRQAAERFEVAGDVRHEEVVIHMRKFLALPLTVSVLDGSYKKPIDDEPISTTTGEGVILSAKGDQDKKVGDDKSESVKEDKKFEENMDNLLAEAEADLANMKTGEDDPELHLDDNNVEGGSADDAIADFENMLKEADNELAELMSS